MWWFPTPPSSWPLQSLRSGGIVIFIALLAPFVECPLGVFRSTGALAARMPQGSCRRPRKSPKSPMSPSRLLPRGHFFARFAWGLRIATPIHHHDFCCYCCCCWPLFSPNLPVTALRRSGLRPKFGQPNLSFLRSLLLGLLSSHPPPNRPLAPGHWVASPLSSTANSKTLQAGKIFLDLIGPLLFGQRGIGTLLIEIGHSKIAGVKSEESQNGV
jgi:hypothetical protein